MKHFSNHLHHLFSRVRAVLQFLTVLLLAVVASRTHGAEITPYTITYSWSGGRVNFGETRISINPDGSTVVTILRDPENPVVHETSLNENEQAALCFAIDTANFFEVAVDNISPLQFGHAGKKILTVDDGNRRRTIEFATQEELSPVQNYLFKLVRQADLFVAASGNERAYDIFSAIEPSIGGPAVLQPYLFTPILVNSLEKQTEPRELAKRLQVLSSLLTPEEFAGVIYRNLPEAHSDEWIFWWSVLSDLQFYNSLEHAHLEALLPLFQAQLQDFILRQQNSSLNEDEEFALIMLQLLFKTYEPTPQKTVN